ncbi:gamma-glutamylcyclotransferase [Chamaesiphon sp. VAR_48_metabat_135_sub]|uniref:gamma-glutamylcyclotransferase family protein n=1 Tax=Chamaesiphon sp. VAR_48_metabat_135_sub TaxID=2964699 RepID=UPI00286C1CEA|nr:gamma-glutamylcyclotransferase [Chamaesiphon sp. VAR_48_metabat_135_sub]
MSLHIFVYGTLKPGATNFDRYCGTKIITSHRAYIGGKLYHFPSLGYPGAIHGFGQVHGFVFSFDDRSILLELDELEDYDPQRQPAENDYTRELVTTYTLNGNFHRSTWAYFMNPQHVRQFGGVLLPDGWWVS